jgi:hypothetical protein
MVAMDTPQESFAEALHQAHTDLLEDLRELEQAARPDSGTSPAELGAHLGEMRKHLLDHFRFEEQDGYMAPVLKEEPRFEPEVRELLAEHHQLAQSLDTLLIEVRTAPRVQDAQREKLAAWLKSVRLHEGRENNLVQEAYYSSGATGD